MAGINTTYGRTTPLMVSNMLYSRLRETQAELLRKQEEIATNKSVIRPSDAPEKTSGILYLRQQLQAREQYGRNLGHAIGVLNNADAALQDASDLVREAKSVASSQVGVGSDTETRAVQSDVIAAKVQGLLEIANRQFSHISLFGGDRGARPDGPIFEEFLGGVRYRGSTENLNADVGAPDALPFTSNGLEAFGALSSRVKSEVDLQVQAVAATRLGDVRGVLGEGVRRGSVVLDVNGTQAEVDLTTADTLGDVVTRVNDAIAAIAPGAGALATAGQGFTLTSTAGNTVTIADIGSGKTAADLGIGLTSTGGVPAAGAAVGPRLTATTSLASLGTAVDWASGLTITQGEQTKTADFSGAQTVEDLVNVVNDLNLGLRLEINAEADGLDLISEVSGIRLSIGENGGTTAADLGLRTLGADTRLADFRDGLGVGDAAGDDFSVTLHDGRSFDVDIAGVTTAGELVTAVRNAATAAGVVVGAEFDIDLAAVGNGFTLTDNTAGGFDFQVRNLGTSLSADHLGIKKNVGAAAVIDGDDNATVRAESVFTHLIELREALKNDDTPGITLAGGRIEEDLKQLAQSHAGVGVNAKRLEQHQQRTEDMTTLEKTMLSDLQDADLAEVITRFTQLQQQLQASMQVGAQNLQLSLMDFLR